MTQESEMLTENSVWFDPASGKQVEFSHIVGRILSNRQYTVHVGTDSHRVKGQLDSHMFATVVCLYEQGKGGDYYFRRVEKHGKYGSLRQRIMEEVSHSVDVAVSLTQFVSHNRIVVHADVNSDPRHKTFNFLGQIRSWISSVGLGFHCKPDSWASSGVADKHAK